MLVTLHKIVVNFCFLGFPVKAENENFTAAGSNCSQHLKYENSKSSFGGRRQKIARAARFIFPYSTNHIIDLWRCRSRSCRRLPKGRNTRYRNPQLVTQHCFVASFGSMFRVFHLAWSSCRATIKFVAGWQNAASWLVDLLHADLIWPHLLRDKLWVRWMTSNKAKICYSK